MSTKTVSCNGVRRHWHGDRSADMGREAAKYFAGILARREYGRSGVVGALRENSTTTDGSSATWEAFIGYRCGGGITGHNVWLHLDVCT